MHVGKVSTGRTSSDEESERAAPTPDPHKAGEDRLKPRLGFGGCDVWLPEEVRDSDCNSSFSDPAAFLNNGIAQTLKIRTYASGITTKDVERSLEILGVNYSMALSRISIRRKVSDGSATYHTDQGIAGAVAAQEIPKELFSGHVTASTLHTRHVQLLRMSRQLFNLDISAMEGPAPFSPVSSSSIGSKRNNKSWKVARIAHCTQCANLRAAVAQNQSWSLARQIVNRVITNKAVSAFFLLLTLYALFSADAVKMFGTDGLDPTFMLINTVVFCFFCLEMVLLTLGSRGYILSANVLVDAVCLVSLVGDTYFLPGGLFDDTESRISRMARSSRTIRLLRIARIARVTRLVPLFMKCFRRQNQSVAIEVLKRRLWRVFALLDVDGDGFITLFDVKWVYLTLLNECTEMLEEPKDLIMKFDLNYLCDITSKYGGDAYDGVTHDMLTDIILGSRVGKNVVHHHVNELDKEEGTWNMTQRLSDRAALRVCVGLLALVAVVLLLEPNVVDMSAQRSLGQLDFVGGKMHASNSTQLNTYVCRQVDLYRQDRDVLFLYLNGRTYVDGGDCIQDGILASKLDPFTRVDEVIQSSSRRDTELLLACWPPDMECRDNVTSSISLLDQRGMRQREALWSILTIITVIAMLMLFVFVLNRKITAFSRTILQPLKCLVDDMLAMSSLELLNLDKGMPTTPGMDVPVELAHLQTAFKSMQSAIRSWSMYVPPGVVERLLSAGVVAGIGVTRINATILFCDINGFGDICKDLEPYEVITMLGTVLEKIAAVIHEHGGTLLEFIGDEVLGLFNAPNKLRQHAFAGVQACQEIHAAIDKEPFFELTGKHQQVEIHCRCGLHTGNVLVGNLGSPRRIKYGVLGDGINLAARLKSLNSRYGTRTLLSQSVLDSTKYGSKQITPGGRFVIRPVDLVTVKGKKEPTAVYELVTRAVDEVAIRDACLKHTEAFRLYLDRHFQDADDLFAEVLSLHAEAGYPQELPSRLLRRRCAKYREEPPPLNWDGVDHLTAKTFEEEVQALMAWERQERMSFVEEQLRSRVRVEEQLDEEVLEVRGPGSESWWSQLACMPQCQGAEKILPEGGWEAAGDG